MQLKDYPDVLTVADLMDILKIGKNKAYELINKNIIHSHRIGRCFRIPKCCVYDYLKSAQYGNI
jgi:excisionase family DNA binding protein